MKRLGGWHRLLMVFSLLYLLAVACFVWMRFPIEKNVIHTDEIYTIMAPRSVSKLTSTGGEIPIEMPNGHVLHLPASTSVEEMKVVVQDYANALRLSMERQRRSLLRRALLAWVIPVGMLYLLGWAAHWVYLGFQREPGIPK